MRRYALVTGMGLTERAVSAHLPENYRFDGFVVERLASTVCVSGANSTFVPRDDSPLGNADRLCAVVSGEDNAGWTLDGYVRPRLASGSYGCAEIDLSHPALKAIPV